MADILRDGDTCWRTARADALAFLIDGAEYFAAVKAAMLKARRSIWILAWVFDPLTRLEPDRVERSGDPATADRLGLLLRRLAALHPGLDVRILAWDMPFPLNASQAFAPQRAAAEFIGSRVKFRLDNSLPNSACHHQKMVVIDGRLAFVSGGDLAVDRWDTCDHADGDRHRRLPNLRSYRPRHDVAVMVEGPVVQNCARLFADRWGRSEGDRLDAPPPDVSTDSPWPANLIPDLTGRKVALVRTRPAWKEQSEIIEGLKLHLAAIASARRCIYLENQYLAAPTIVEALSRRLAEPDGPEVVAVGPSASPSFFDRMTMDSARMAAISTLTRADTHGRFHAYCARTPDGAPIIVHSKVTIIDDRFLRIGSANLNNRSGGLDTELDLALEAEPGEAGQATRAAITGFRDGLVAHFLGRTFIDTQAAIAAAGSLGAAIDALDGATRRLRPVEIHPLGPLETFIRAWALGDPTAPSDAWRPWVRRRRLRAQLSLIPPPEPSPPPPQSAAGGRTPPATADRRATRSRAR
ncbi:MAG: phospholipase [Caulobacterales bacterium]|nr:phospholipase [Caulobacterales bacterium]